MLPKTPHIKISKLCKILILLALFSCQLLSAQISQPDEDPKAKGDMVTIYTDFIEQSFGRSPYRQALLSVDLRAFERYRSYPVAEPGGWLTAVVMRKETVDKLRAGTLPISSSIHINRGKYYLNYKGISLVFSVEGVTTRQIEMIERVYANLPTARSQVLDYYRQNFVIRIYEAEDLFHPQVQEISFFEAMLSATIIGDSQQWLWGVHDARDILNKPF